MSCGKRSAYEWYRTTIFWAARRKKVFARAGYICENCHVRPAEECHHVTYANLFDEPLCDLVALCRKCHSKLHFGTPANDNQIGFSFSMPDDYNEAS